MGNCSSAEISLQKSGGGAAVSRRRVNANTGSSAFKLRNTRGAGSTELRQVSPELKRRASSERKNPSGSRSMCTTVEEFRQNAWNIDLIVFTHGELAAATKNFRSDKILGEGGFGVVYKGLIDQSVRVGFRSNKVAVKELNPDGFQGDREWLAEVHHLSQLSHPNLVKLLGYCCEADHRLLVYEFMACGSLDKHLFRRVCQTMSWPTRLKIVLGAAKGLAFLHGAERPVIYRDFKTSNILLDAVCNSYTSSFIAYSCSDTRRPADPPFLYDAQDYNAKLSDFGLAKEGPVGDDTHVSTRVVGTHGYAAPEYVMTGRLTARSDVYGFGVVLLEMLTGRRAVDKSRPSRQRSLAEWARPLLTRNRKLIKIVDPRMEGQYTAGTIQRVARLAYECLSQSPKSRPTMQQVVETLEALRALPENAEHPALGGGWAAVTLYEVPWHAAGDVHVERNSCPDKANSEVDLPG